MLFDGRGYVLYAFTYDQTSKSRCYGACAKAWPPYLVKKPKAGTGAKQSLLGTTRRTDGSIQVTYNGRPLYYYVDDGKGQILCQNVRRVRRPLADPPRQRQARSLSAVSAGDTPATGRLAASEHLVDEGEHDGMAGLIAWPPPTHSTLIDGIAAASASCRLA